MSVNEQVAITSNGERYHKVLSRGRKWGSDELWLRTHCGLDSWYTSLFLVSREDVPWEPCKVCYGRGAKRRVAWKAKGGEDGH